MLQTLKRSWISFSAFVVISILISIYAADNHPITGFAGTTMLVILGIELLLAMSYRPFDGPAPGDDFRVTLAIAAYNEDPATLAGCLNSILGQTRLPAKVHVIDDGSSSSAAVDVAREMSRLFLQANVEYAVDVQPTNRGKREALARVFRGDPKADVYLCVDSDTILAPKALAEGLKPFADPEVQVVTGLVLAANRDTNLLTKLINLRYGNAFGYERAAHTQVGRSMLCACGSLALYRADMVRDNLDDFLGQMFLGKRAEAGDDRRMTNYGLMRGKSVYQETARADTAVPEKLNHFLRQQIRWNRSFFRESTWVLLNMSKKKPAWWLTMVEAVTWIVFSGFVLVAVARLGTGSADAVAYLVYISLFGYARSVRYLDLPDVQGPFWQKAAAFALAPVYGALHVIVLTPIRFYAMCTLTAEGWGTRSKVEVGLTDTQSRFKPDKTDQ